MKQIQTTTTNNSNNNNNTTTTTTQQQQQQQHQQTTMNIGNKWQTTTKNTEHRLVCLFVVVWLFFVVCFLLFACLFVCLFVVVVFCLLLFVCRFLLFVVCLFVCLLFVIVHERTMNIDPHCCCRLCHCVVVVIYFRCCCLLCGICCCCCCCCCWCCCCSLLLFIVRCRLLFHLMFCFNLFLLLQFVVCSFSLQGLSRCLTASAPCSKINNTLKLAFRPVKMLYSSIVYLACSWTLLQACSVRVLALLQIWCCLGRAPLLPRRRTWPDGHC